MASSNHINNTRRDYTSIKEDLISMSQKYYPTIATSFNDGSVGSWFIDLIASVGDSLNYAIDRAFQETRVATSSSRETALNNAVMNGIKVPGSKAASCEVTFSCTLPASSDVNLSSPDWSYAPIIKRGAIVSCGSYSFELQEDVNFHEQFNAEGYSNRTFMPNRDSNGITNGYTVTKTAVVLGGTTKVYKKTISEGELEPFMEVILPDTDVLNVESIIFKETPNYNISPKTYEYYVPREMWISPGENVYTHRYFEVESLAEQYAFVDESEPLNETGQICSVVYNSVDPITNANGEDTGKGSVVTSHLYKGRWLTIRQKFTTEYTAGGYLKIIFGPSNAASQLPEPQTDYADYVMSNILNNQFLGVLPDSNWTMFVLYRVGGGAESNVAPNSINTISSMTVDMPYYTGGTNPDATQQRSATLSSISVTNAAAALGGKDAPSTEEIKFMTKYNISAQGRCVTLKDYKARIMMMPPRYGCPFRVSVIEENGKILISTLGIDMNGGLTNEISSVLKGNIITYLSNYKMMTDHLHIKSGRIYDLQFEFSIYLDKGYDTNDVATNVINTVQEYMDVNMHDMGESIFIGDLQKEITNLDGVIAIISFDVFNIYDRSQGYHDKASLPEYTEGPCGPSTGNSTMYQIDINALDGLLTCDYDAMFQIKDPSKDVKLRIKLK